MQAIAGLAVLAGAVLAFQQLTEDRQQAAADRDLTRQGQASERFTRAITQLGSDRREVQIGGIYGLEQIAKEPPELSNAHLEGANLDGALLFHADLSHADLRDAEISAVHLEGANLSHANLRGTKLFQSNLSAADLSSADLRERSSVTPRLISPQSGRHDSIGIAPESQ